MFADYFTVAVRTGGPGGKGLSFMLLDKSMPGISCKQMDCSGVWASGTAFITFDNVKVPVENLIGTENDGFKYVMCVRYAHACVCLPATCSHALPFRYNFNHERWGFIVQANRFSRVCFEDAFRYAHKRKTFGKALVEHPVIRWKLAEMARQIETTHAMLETLTYQMKTMTKAEQNTHLAGDCALIKAHATKVFEYCAREAAQIFGGSACACCVHDADAPRAPAAHAPRALSAQTCAAARGSVWNVCTGRSGHTPFQAAARRSCWTWACGRP